ncbi:MAG TPA: sulfatase-like hydrolase/transferase [Parafilimonas sp.]|nr:sulfatase-like hydrolase/transferase [Parafilimonas sp.]
MEIPKRCSVRGNVINRTLFLAFGLLLFFSCKKQFDAGDKQPPPPPSDKTNIILILADDIGYEVPTCNGGQSYETPNLDKMANEGMRFTECHSTPLCSPSRFMFLTGKYNFRNYTAWGQMDVSQRTIANMLKSAGYATCVAGKWQLDGGDASVHAFGFDSYCLWNPYFAGVGGSRYKNPHIYEDGGYWSAAKSEGNYGEDVFTNYVLNFIETNQKASKPFFVYYPMCLSHAPFSPTPDDADYAAWLKGNDPKYFKSMIKYMDKKIGQIVDKVNELNIANNTVILFTTDNGTPDSIASEYDGDVILGGKSSTTEYGTHVPLLAYAPGLVPHMVNDELIDFTDFLPTAADIAKISEPDTYGVLDGTSFYQGLTGHSEHARSWIFCHFDPHPGNDTVERYVQNTIYKYYEDDRFYDIVADILEEHPIPDSLLSVDEQNVKSQFKDVLGRMHN